MAATVSTIPGGVTTPRGFRAAGVSAGIKANHGLDLALLVSDGPAQAAAVFTTNLALAAPVVVSREHLARSGGTARAVIVNSGCANACTGDEGMQAARDMAGETARIVPCPAEQVLVASTGVIGVALPIDKIRDGLPAAFGALGADQGAMAARAIMTTDPFPTDAAAPKTLLDRALREAVGDTFNAITVDGECSTNDCVMLLANGASGVAIDEVSYATFAAGLTAVCRELALGIVRGGEGATKLVTVMVKGAASSDEARKAAKAIANSLLVKTAIHGGDPNWGRLIAVAGRAGVAFELSRAAVMIGSTVLLENGRPHDEASPEAAEYLTGKDLTVSVDLGAGGASSTVWTCDLSAEYVRINADY